MGKIKFDVYEGLIPAREASLLPENASQVAHNCSLVSGKLIPLNMPTDIGESVPSDTETIYHFRPFGKGGCDDVVPPPSWVHFPFDADFANSPVNGDKYERVYYTGNPDHKIHQLVAGANPGDPPLDSGGDLEPPTQQITASGRKMMFNPPELYLAVYDVDLTDPNNPIYTYYPADDPIPYHSEKQEEITSENKQDFGASIVYRYDWEDPANIDITGHSDPTVAESQLCYLLKLNGISGRYNPPSNTPFPDHNYLSSFTGEMWKDFPLIDPVDWAFPGDPNDPADDITYGHTKLDYAKIYNDKDSYTTLLSGNAITVTPVSDLGKPKVPVVASLDFSKNGGMNLPAEADYVYIYQYIDSHGTPSPIYGMKSVDDHSEGEDPLKIENRRFFERLIIEVPSIPTQTSTGYPIEYVRVYRSLAASKTGGFFMVKEIKVPDDWDGTGTFSFHEWEKEIPGFSFDNVTPPPDCLKGLVLQPGRFLAAFRGDTVYLSDINAPYSWSHFYTIDSEIVGIAINGSDIVVLTTGSPTILSGINPGQMRLSKMAIEQSCTNKQAICKVGEIVTYASPDGIVFISGGQANLVSKGLVRPKQWRALHPESMLFVQHDSQVYITSKDNPISYRFDPHGQALSLITVDGNFEVSYNDMFDDSLYYVFDDKIFSFDSDLNNNMLMFWRCREIDINVPVLFTKCRVLSLDYPVYLHIFVDGTLFKRMTIESERVYHLPVRRRDEIWSIMVESEHTVRRLELGQSMEDFMQ